VTHVQIVLFDGFDPLDVIGPHEVLWAASLFAPGRVSVELGSAEGPRAVRSGTGLTLPATAHLDPDAADVIVLPGAAGRVGEADDLDPALIPETIPAILARTLDNELRGVVERTMKHPTCVLACVCGGALIPAMAGLLEGRPAVTNHLGMDLLDATGTRAVAARVVDDGDLVTAGGVTSGLDVALHLVDRFVGPRIAHAVEELFEFERRGVVWREVGPTPLPI
jgi:transcriptional regulator GlxA family with amidase domain